ncbi:MAG: retropepsin-like aspartic protease family protein [Methylosarcina sp.]
MSILESLINNPIGKMRIQDRNYYQERYRDSSSPSKRGKTSTGFKYLGFLALLFAALWYGGSDAVLEKIKLPERIESADSVKPIPKISDIKLPNLIPSGISLKTDRHGHFRGTILVNNIPMPFLIDTGATQTVLPAKMAIAAGLPFGRAVEANTAGGKAVEYITRINSLKIGNAEIRNLDAHINEHLIEVLIGMSTLRYFRMTQNGNMLTLEANNPRVRRVTDTRTAASAASGSSPTRQLINKPIIVKKKIICDERQVCKTIYSDH